MSATNRPAARTCELLPAAGLLLAIAAAHAQDGGRRSDYVAIRCDAAAAVVRVEKHVDARLAEMPREPGVRRLDAMVGTRPKGDDDAWLFPMRDLVRRCAIGRARYVVRARAQIWGTTGMGRCGAAPVSVAVSVTRNGAVLLKDFVMGDACGDTDTLDMDVTSLVLSEAARALTVDATLDAGPRLPRLPFDTNWDFAALPALTLQRVHAARPAASTPPP